MGAFWTYRCEQSNVGGREHGAASVDESSLLIFKGVAEDRFVSRPKQRSDVFFFQAGKFDDCQRFGVDGDDVGFLVLEEGQALLTWNPINARRRKPFAEVEPFSAGHVDK